MRLRRSNVWGKGIRRQRRGRGFRYLDCDGGPLRDPEVLARIRGLVIPPAWQQVWICEHPNGHIQAVGTDDAGRRQYLYHEQWRARRDKEKYRRVVELAKRLPEFRAAVDADLSTSGLGRLRELAGDEFTAKDLRTWHATVLAAAAVATIEPPESGRGRARAEAAVMRTVADQLGNTPAVARRSYVDPRVLSTWERGRTIDAGSPAELDKAVVQLLDGED